MEEFSFESDRVKKKKQEMADLKNENNADKIITGTLKEVHIEMDNIDEQS